MSDKLVMPAAGGSGDAGEAGSQGGGHRVLPQGALLFTVMQ